MSTIQISYPVLGSARAVASWSTYGRSVDRRWSVAPIRTGVAGEVCLRQVTTPMSTTPRRAGGRAAAAGNGMAEFGPITRNQSVQLLHEFDKQPPSGSSDCSPPV